VPERLHRNLSDDRWRRMEICEQLANVGAEVGRSLAASARQQQERADQAMERALELFDLTVADPRHRGRRLREVCRAREVYLDYLVGDNQYGSTAASLEAYFTQFALATRRLR